MIKLEGTDRLEIHGAWRLLGVGLIEPNPRNARATLTVTRQNMPPEVWPLFVHQVNLSGGHLCSEFEPEMFYTFLSHLNLIEVNCTKEQPFLITVEPATGVNIIAYLTERNF